VELTARCNLRCAHCYINVPEGEEDALNRELTTIELRHLIDCMVEEGTLWLLLTGGEPLLRPDFADIYIYAKTKGLLINLFTNGTLLSAGIADLLAEYPPISVEITLYGATQKTYERVTSVPGSYSRCMRGIELMLDRQIQLGLKSMVLSLNKHEIGDMRAYAENLGIDFRFDPLLNARLDGGSDPIQLRIPPDEVVALDLADKRRMKEWLSFMQRFGSAPSDPGMLYDCGAGLAGFHVDPYGNMTVCMMSRYRKYGLRQGNFTEGWHEFLPRVREQTRTRISPCSSCHLISLCGQCPGWGHLESGDPEEPVEYLCEVAHLRAKAFCLAENGAGGRPC
jgi:radical SAM protein with 4Fe4S-binding SPASM domain